MSVVFINCFDVPRGRDAEFLALWTEVNDYMRARDGYLGHRLHRASTVTAPYRFVNVAEWASAEHWAAAHDDGFRALVGRPEWAEFGTHPGLYDVVDQAG